MESVSSNDEEVTKNDGHSSALRSAKVWTVHMAPPVNSLKGHLLPKTRLRRIIFEERDNHYARGKERQYEKTIHILEPSKEVLGFSISKLDKQSNVSTASNEVIYDHDITNVKAGWSQKYDLPLRNVSIQEMKGRSCVFTTKINRLMQTRVISFHSETDARDFFDTIKSHKEKERIEVKERYSEIFSSDGMDGNESINLLFEVVSAWDLCNNLTYKPARPYVVATLNNEEVHQTKSVNFTNNPIWTISENSLFVLETKVNDLFLDQKGMMFEVKDKKMLGTDETFGHAWFNPTELYHANGSRIESKLYSFESNSFQEKGTIAIRCRHATQSDLSFLFKFNNKLQNDDMEKEHFPIKTKRPIVGPPILIKNKQTDKHGVIKHRVRPEPDPNNTAETEWLNESQIEDFSKKDSTTWMDIGSGKLARVFFEVISCDGLPKSDGHIGLQNSSDKSDVFVSIVYEDSAIFTDVIDNCYSPRWMPWTRRAFIFHMMHPSSQINLGVFDHEFLGNHDYIGRVSIDITNLNPNVMYNIRYNLKTNSRFESRENKGFINVRLRIAYDNEHSIMKASLRKPPEVFVNVRTKKELNAITRTCFGLNNMNSFHIRHIKSYLSELESYSKAQVYVLEAVKHVLLWKNTFSFTVGIPYISSTGQINLTRGVSIAFPLHSMLVFVSGIAMIERPELIPSIFFAWIALILQSTSDFRQKHPNPWYRQKSLSQFIRLLFLGKHTSNPHVIVRNENKELIQEYTELWDRKMEEAQNILSAQSRIRNEISKETQKLENLALDNANPLNMTMGIESLQNGLEKVCNVLRFTQNVVLWEESYFSFLFFVGSIILSIVFILLPWQRVFLWSIRIIAWTLLGPWMKVVDIWFFSTSHQNSDKEEMDRLDNHRKLYRDTINRSLRDVRLRCENALKLNAMKSYLFGTYITRVPVMKQDRFYDKPLPESFSEKYEPTKLSLGKLAIHERGLNIERVDGQQLVGDMIHERVTHSVASQVRSGQHIRDESLLSPESVAAGIQEVSSLAALAKIGSLVGMAGFISWHLVPILIYTITWATHL